MSTRREKLIETAKNLFYKYGYRATGIDQILEEAGVSKPTMYKYFRSKDELIIASLRLWDSEFHQDLNKSLESFGGGAHDRLMHIFDFLETWFQREDFRGCMSINASVEYPEEDSPIHACAAEQKRGLKELLERLLRESGHVAPGDTAAQLAVLIDGAIVAAHLAKNSVSATVAKRMANTLLESNTSTVAA